MTSGFPVLPAQTVNNPEDFGFFGWTADPIGATTTAAPTLGQVGLVRFRAGKSGVLGHLAYTVTAGGGTLVAGQNLVGIYDTGQSTPGVATLLSSSADQTANMGTPATYQGVLSTPPILIAGQDYFGALLNNGASAATFERMSSSGALGLWNIGLSGLALRTATSGSGLTALPATIAAGSIAGGGASYAFVYLA